MGVVTVEQGVFFHECNRQDWNLGWLWIGYRLCHEQSVGNGVSVLRGERAYWFQDQQDFDRVTIALTIEEEGSWPATSNDDIGRGQNRRWKMDVR